MGINEKENGFGLLCILILWNREGKNVILWMSLVREKWNGLIGRFLVIEEQNV